MTEQFLSRATKIVATIAQNAEKPGALERLIEAGVDVVRLNGAHCRPGEIKRRVAIVRAVEKKMDRPIGVLLDLGGPKIRVGPVSGGGVIWKTGASVEIVPGMARGDERRISVTYPDLLDDVQTGAEIRIDDGRIRLHVDGRRGAALRATVIVGGRVKSEAGVNFPNSALSAPALTAKDRRDLAEGLEAGVDFVGLSFVRSAAHVIALRRLLKRMPEDSRPWIVAKIERREALLDLWDIAEASDVLMVARGDLGVEIGLASVPRAQHEILAVGRALSVPVIVATQMLESMIENPSPTRAEVSDVAGAVHDGADAVMLSGETAIGAYPVEAVTVMAEIALKAEAPDSVFATPIRRRMKVNDFSAVIASTASQVARDAGAKGMVVYTEYGRTARLVSKEQLSIQIVAFTPRETVRRRLTLLRDVDSFLVPKSLTVEEMIRAGDRVLVRLPGFAGATVVELSGTAPTEGATNTVRIRKLPVSETAPAKSPRRPARLRR
ncbi:MAG: pyruvate kinase [Thermoanaerobaculia bacterium]